MLELLKERLEKNELTKNYIEITGTVEDSFPAHGHYGAVYTKSTIYVKYSDDKYLVIVEEPDRHGLPTKRINFEKEKINDDFKPVDTKIIDIINCSDLDIAEIAEQLDNEQFLYCNIKIDKTNVTDKNIEYIKALLEHVTELKSK